MKGVGKGGGGIFFYCLIARGEKSLSSGGAGQKADRHVPASACHTAMMCQRES